MSERLMHQGKLYQKELAAKDLRLTCRGKVDSLRLLLDPTEKPDNLDAEAISAQAFDLVGSLIELGGLNEEIARIKHVLGQ